MEATEGEPSFPRTVDLVSIPALTSRGSDSMAWKPEWLTMGAQAEVARRPAAMAAKATRRNMCG